MVSSVSESILPIKVLRLQGFVVDALPFAQGFDNLERIDFLANCFDAGFALPEQLREKVEVTTITKDDNDSDSIRVYPREDVQLITETVGELMVRSKSVPDLSSTLCGLGMATAPLRPVSTPSALEILTDDDGPVMAARRAA